MPGRRSARLRRWIGLDRAVLFTIGARAWQTLAGGLTMLLIARNLRPVEQGYYYTFSSLVALQIIFELGFSFVILQTAAHERARLTIFSSDVLCGDPVAVARLASLLKRSIRWYTFAAAALVAALVAIGFSFFTRNPQAGFTVHWQAPWVAVVCATFLTFQMDPIVSFLEGCGQVVQVAKLRMCQAVLGSLLAWLSLVYRHGLFAPALMIAGQAICSAGFLLGVNRKILLNLLRTDTRQHSISWRAEILPFQWRIAVSWASIYATFQLFNPIVFTYCGPVQAGRMGMSLSIATALASMAISWVSTKAAPMGMLVAQNRIAELDRIFRRAVTQSTALLLVAVVCAAIGLSAALHFLPAYAARVLPMPSFLLVLLAIVLGHIVQCEAYYLRAHKREPLLWFWVLIAFLSIASIAAAARYRGVFAVALAYLFCGGVLRLSAATLVFVRKRREWHACGAVS